MNLMKLTDSILWMVFGEFLKWEDLRCMNKALVNKNLRSNLDQFLTVMSFMGGTFNKVHNMASGGNVAVQFMNLQVSPSRQKNKAIVVEVSNELNSSVNLTSLSFKNCKSDGEIIVTSLSEITLQRLQSVIVVKTNIIDGTVSAVILKRVINNGQSLTRLELLCNGVTYSVVDSLSAALVSRLTILRLELSNISASSLCAVLRMITLKVQHFQLFCHHQLYSLQLEFISSLCDRNDITCPRSVKSQEDHQPGNTLIMLGGHSLNAVLDILIVDEVPWWGCDLTSLIWQLTEDMSLETFEIFLSANKDLKSLELNLTDNTLSLEDLCIGLTICPYIECLTIYDGYFDGDELVVLVCAIPSVRVLRLVHQGHIGLYNIRDMFAGHKALNEVSTWECAREYEEIMIPGLGFVVSKHEGESTVFRRTTAEEEANHNAVRDHTVLRVTDTTKNDWDCDFKDYKITSWYMGL
jgi:hypothetical protein